MNENTMVSKKPQLPSIAPKTNDAERPAMICYERVDAAHYSFSCALDEDFHFRMDEAEQTAKRTDFVEAEFADAVPESDRAYYALAAASGILTGTLSMVRLSEEQRKAIEQFREKDWKPLLIRAAGLAGYQKGDYKGAAKYLVTRAVRTIEKTGKTKEYWSVLEEHPSVAGLLFSILTQYAGKTIVLSEKGDITGQKLPDYYVIGDSNAEKLVCAVFYWLFHLAADEMLSKRHVIDGLGISKALIKKIKEFAHFPFLKQIASDYAGAEKAFSEWMGKTLKGAVSDSGQDSGGETSPWFTMMRAALDLSEDAFPVLINDGIVRSLFILLRLCSVVKERQVTSFEDLAGIPVSDILPSDGKLLSRMCLIASASFAGVNIAGAVLKAIKNKRADGRRFSDTFLAELNVAGIGRFVFACASDSKYWGEDIKIILQRLRKDRAAHAAGQAQPMEENGAFEPLFLDAIQARILYCLEGIAVRYDIERTRKSETAQQKQLWLDTWKRIILEGIDAPPELAAQYFTEDEDVLYEGIYQLAKDKRNWRWFYLLTEELALFKPYRPLGHPEDRAFQKLKCESDYLSDQFIRRQTIATQGEVEAMVKAYGKYTGYVSGSTQNKRIGAGVAAAATVATGGLALSFAPGIAAAIAGEAVVGLHGAALTSASLAFVGGGSLAAGGLGMAGGTAIITGGGALLGLAGSGTVSAAAVLLQTPGEYWVRQSAKLLTYCSCVLAGNLQDKPSVRAILRQLESAVAQAERELEGIKAEKSDLDREIIKKTETYLKYLKRCRNELEQISQ